MSLQQVHFRINDAATGQPTPVRLRITDAAGTYYAPYGRLTEFATGVNQDVGGNVLIGAKKWAYIDGTCEILLPPGTLHIEITKGPEYKPIDEEITLLAGKMSRRFTIERWIDMRKEGWYSGDTRLHFLSPDAALLEGQAEDVAIVNLLVKETTVKDSFGKTQRAIPNVLSFSGQTFARQTESCGVAINTHNSHAELGSLGLLHCHRMVHPLTSSDSDWTLDDWCGQCHRKKGLVVWTNPHHQTADFLFGEPLADAILCNLDAFELTFFEDSPFDALADYYNLLNAGIFLSLVGASGKDNNGVALGAMRTYAFVESCLELSYPLWIEAIRAGRTYVSNGPLLQVIIEGEVPGRSCHIAHGQELRLTATATCMTAFERLELVWNGKVIRTCEPISSDPHTAMLVHEITTRECGWLAIRCIGETLVPSRPAPQRVFAHSSPVAIWSLDVRQDPSEDAVRPLLAELDNMIRWAELRQFNRLVPILQEARTMLS